MRSQPRDNCLFMKVAGYLRAVSELAVELSFQRTLSLSERNLGALEQSL